MYTELENVLSNFYKTEMIDYMTNHPECFDEAVNLAITNKQPYSWRAAWLLWSCIEDNDARIRNHIGSIIKSISGKKDGHQRELIKILYVMDIDDKYEGFLFDHCVQIWEKINKDPSVRFNAFKMIIKIAKRYPELQQEIVLLTQEHYLETLSKGVKRSLVRIIEGYNN